MAYLRTTVALIAMAVFWLGATSASGVNYNGFKIIVHSRNPATSVSRPFLQDVFMRRATRWSNGDAVRPIDLPQVPPVRDRFTLEVLEKTPAQLRSYWLQRIFSGTNVPPPEASSASAAISYVVANEGAVAYLPADVDAGPAKIIPSTDRRTRASEQEHAASRGAILTTPRRDRPVAL